MDAAAELGRNPAMKHQIQPEYGDQQTDAGRDGCPSRGTKFSGTHGDRGILFPLFSRSRARLTTLPDWSILWYMWWPYIHTYTYTYIHTYKHCAPSTVVVLISGWQPSRRMWTCCSCFFVFVFFTLTDRASTIPSNIRGCQPGTTWSAGQKKIRGTSTKLQWEQKKNTNTQKTAKRKEQE